MPVINLQVPLENAMDYPILPPVCLTDLIANPACGGSVIFDSFTASCRPLHTIRDAPNCVNYFKSMDHCASTCVPSRKVSVETLVPPKELGWNQWTCQHQPCGSDLICVDEALPVSCFVSPCPQFSCYEAI